MKKNRRSSRVGDQMRDEIANIVRTDLRGLDIGFVTITGVDLSSDLKDAKVWVSTLEDDRAEESVAALQRVQGKIRQVLGTRMRFRQLPGLDFRVDRTAARAMKIERLLSENPSSDPVVEDDEGAVTDDE